MFTIRLQTATYLPDRTMTLRSSRTGWLLDEPGLFRDGAWQFAVHQPAGPFEFKLLLDGTWMDGANLTVPAVDGAVHDIDGAAIDFPRPRAIVVENGLVQQMYLPPVYDDQHEYDAIVVGSGMGGGLVADELADAGADVLVLEAGSYLFPTHVANLPRRLRIGVFDKHVWGLYPDFAVPNYVNAPGSNFGGAQAFNLGGRSLFWGGLIPRMGLWELESWPPQVRDYLLSSGYRLAEDALNRNGPVGSSYQEAVKTRLSALLPDFDHLDAPVAVQYQGYTPLSIPGGMFSTADLLLEDRLVDQPGRLRPQVNLNHAVHRVLHAGGRANGVECFDLLGGRLRTYRAKAVILAAGTIESAKIALASGLDDPAGLIGAGISDHPIWYTHFALPAGNPLSVNAASAKVWSRHREVAVDRHPYNVVVELGADFNQGRYVDPDHLAAQRAAGNGGLLGEIVFLFNADLVPENAVTAVAAPHIPVTVNVAPCPLPPGALDEVRAISATVLEGIGAVPLAGESLELKAGALGGVAHEVGTLRMGLPGNSVVDADLRFHAYENLYACDNSVFCTSPAANPSLTLAALALRLARHVAT